MRRKRDRAVRKVRKRQRRRMRLPAFSLEKLDWRLNGSGRSRSSIYGGVKLHLKKIQVQCLSDNITLLVISNCHCHINRWFSLCEDLFWNSKNSYYLVSFNPVVTV